MVVGSAWNDVITRWTEIDKDTVWLSGDSSQINIQQSGTAEINGTASNGSSQKKRWVNMQVMNINSCTRCEMTQTFQLDFRNHMIMKNIFFSSWPCHKDSQNSSCRPRRCCLQQGASPSSCRLPCNAQRRWRKPPQTACTPPELVSASDAPSRRQSRRRWWRTGPLEGNRKRRWWWVGGRWKTKNRQRSGKEKDGVNIKERGKWGREWEKTWKREIELLD